MSRNTPDLALMVRKLMNWFPLDESDQAAILALPCAVRSYARGSYFVREGDKATHAGLLLNGFAYRQKVVGDGGRQILALAIAGDLLDLPNAVLRTADHNVQALTNCDIAMIPRDAIRRIARERPNVGEAMWHDTLVDASISREWQANLGRRNARVRTSHLLCEFGVRLQQAGLGKLQRYEMPMTQEDLADALGLTPVHVNRTLMSLSKDGLIERRRWSVFINNFKQLADAGDFSPDYLHLEHEMAATPS